MPRGKYAGILTAMSQQNEMQTEKRDCGGVHLIAKSKLFISQKSRMSFAGGNTTYSLLCVNARFPAFLVSEPVLSTTTLRSTRV